MLCLFVGEYENQAYSIGIHKKMGILIDNIKIEEQMQEIKTLVYENNPS